MSSEHRTHIIIAIIGLVGVVATALFTNWDKMFPPKKTIVNHNIHSPLVKANDGKSIQRTNNLSHSNNSTSNKIDIDIDRALAHEHLSKGHQFRKKKDYEVAESYYLKAIEIDQNYIEAYYWLGNTYYYMGRILDAIRMYNRIISIEPNNASAYDGLGNAYYKLGNYDSAVKNFNKAIQISSYANSYDGLASAYYKMGRYSDALSAWQTVLRMEPNNNHAKEWIQRTKDKVD